jgi:lipid-binding SYLF domain-containing protein
MQTIFTRIARYAAALSLVACGAAAYAAGDVDDTIALFRNSAQAASFFHSSYGYAVFPTIGEGGVVVGAAHGTGQVYAHGRYVGDVSMTQLSIGAQLGGKAFSQIVFFQNKRAFDQFTSGNFEFGADASATAITAGAEASVGTTGVNAGASGTEDHAKTFGTYHHGMAVFTIVKGGAMYQAVVSGQKFSYTRR